MNESIEFLKATSTTTHSELHYAIGPPGHGLSAKFVFAAEQYCAN